MSYSDRKEGNWDYQRISGQLKAQEKAQKEAIKAAEKAAKKAAKSSRRSYSAPKNLTVDQVMADYNSWNAKQPQTAEQVMADFNAWNTDADAWMKSQTPVQPIQTQTSKKKETKKETMQEEQTPVKYGATRVHFDPTKQERPEPTAITKGKEIPQLEITNPSDAYNKVVDYKEALRKIDKEKEAQNERLAKNKSARMEKQKARSEAVIAKGDKRKQAVIPAYEKPFMKRTAEVVRDPSSAKRESKKSFGEIVSSANERAKYKRVAEQKMQDAYRASIQPQIDELNQEVPLAQAIANGDYTKTAEFNRLHNGKQEFNPVRGRDAHEAVKAQTKQDALSVLDEQYGRQKYGDEVYERMQAAKPAMQARYDELENILRNGNKAHVQEVNAAFDRLRSAYDANGYYDTARMEKDKQLVEDYQLGVNQPPSGLSLQEELEYNQLSLALLGDRERDAILQIAENTNAMGNTSGANGGAYQQEMMKKNQRLQTQVDELTNVLKQYGWDDEKINEYRLRAERVLRAEKAEGEGGPLFEINDDDNGLATFGKSVGNWIAGRLASIPSMLSIATNFEEKPEGQGLDLLGSPYAYFNRAENRNDQEVLDKAIGDNGVGRFLYGASASMGDMGAQMVVAGGLMKLLGVAGAGEAMASAAKAGETITSAMKYAAGAEKVIQNLSLLSFGAKGYTSAYEQARANGASEEGAQLRALAGGLAEIVTEKISLDNLWGIYNDPNALKNVVKNVLRSGFIEGTEEISSDVINDIADGLVSSMLRDTSTDFQHKVEAYMASGLSEEEAYSKAMQDRLVDYAYDGLAGALSGAGMGGAATIGSEINQMPQKRLQKQIETLEKNAKEARFNNATAEGTNLATQSMPELQAHETPVIEQNNATQDYTQDLDALAQNSATEKNVVGENLPPKTINAGKATYIEDPYTGTTPVYHGAPHRVDISEDAVNTARENFGNPEEDGFKSKIRKYYEERFKKTGQHKVVVNDVSFNGADYVVDVNKRAVSKVVSSGDLSEEKLAVLGDIDKVIENAEYVGSGTYNKQNKKTGQIVRYDYFETPVRIDGKDYVATFDVEVYKDRNNYRTHRVVDEINLTETSSTPNGMPQGIAATPRQRDATTQSGLLSDSKITSESAPVNTQNTLEDDGLRPLSELFDEGQQSAESDTQNSVDMNARSDYDENTGGASNGTIQTSGRYDGTGSEGVLRDIRGNGRVGEEIRGVESEGRGQLPSDSVLPAEQLKGVYSDDDIAVLKQNGIDSPNFYNSNHEAQRFTDSLETAKAHNKNGASVDSHSVEEVQKIVDDGGNLYLIEDATSGYAVEANGNLTAVFKDPINQTPGMGSKIALASTKDGATKGDCFGRKLVNMYARGGFEPVARMKYSYGFNDAMDNQVREQIEKGIISREPDVYALKVIDNYDFNKVASEYNEARQYTQEELDALPEFSDYDEMLAYRDSLIKEIPSNGADGSNNDTTSGKTKRSEVIDNTLKRSGIFNEQEFNELVSDLANIQEQHEQETVDLAISNILNDHDGTMKKYMNAKGNDIKSFIDHDVDAMMMLIQEQKRVYENAVDPETKKQAANNIRKLSLTLRKTGTGLARGLQAFAKWTRNAEGAIATAEMLRQSAVQKVFNNNPKLQNDIAEVAGHIRMELNLQFFAKGKTPTESEARDVVNRILDTNKNVAKRMTDEAVKELTDDILKQKELDDLEDHIELLANGLFRIPEDVEKQVYDIFDKMQKYNFNSKDYVELEKQAFGLLANHIAPHGGTFDDKLDSWRYFSMLFNPLTHLRNIEGNVKFKGILGAKNTIATLIEMGADEVSKKRGKGGIGRTKAFLGKGDAELIEACQQDALENAYRELAGNRYVGVAGGITREIPTFNTQTKRGRFLNKITEANSNALSKEDETFKFGKKFGAYKRAMAGYLKANGADASIFQADDAASKELVNRARQYAIHEAKVATFQQDDKMGEWAKKWAAADRRMRDSDNAAMRWTGRSLDILVPFKTTNANILETAFAYSPAEWMKALTEIGKLKRGAIPPAEFIDHVAKSATGLMGIGIGAILRAIGLIHIGDDDREDAFNKQNGVPTYGIKIGDFVGNLSQSFPAAAPLINGAAIYDGFVKNGTPDPLNTILDGLSTMSDAVTDMSMLSGLTDLFTGLRYSKSGKEMLEQMLYKTGDNLLSQMFPQIGKSINNVIDPTARETSYTDKTGWAGKLDKSRQYLETKIPALPMAADWAADSGIPVLEDIGEALKVQPKIDAKGQVMKNNGGDNALLRFINSTINATNINKDTRSDLDLERIRLEKNPENAKTIPSIDSSTESKIGGEKLSPEDWKEYKQKRGEMREDISQAFYDSDEYEDFSDAERAQIFHEIDLFTKAAVRSEHGGSLKSKQEEYLDLYEDEGAEAVVDAITGDVQAKHLCDDIGVKTNSAIGKDIQSAYDDGDDELAQEYADMGEFITDSDLPSSAYGDAYKRLKWAHENNDDLDDEEWLEAYQYIDSLGDENGKIKRDELLDAMNQDKENAQQYEDWFWNYSTIPELGDDGDYKASRSKSSKKSEKESDDESGLSTTGTNGKSYAVKDQKGYQRGQKAYGSGYTEQQYVDTRSAIDTNGNNSITKAELKAYMAKHPDEADQLWATYAGSKWKR